MNGNCYEDDDDDDDDDNNNNNNNNQSGPLTHGQSHQAQNAAEHTEIKQRRAWTREEIREVVWCYMYCRQHFTEKGATGTIQNHSENT